MEIQSKKTFRIAAFLLFSGSLILFFGTMIKTSPYRLLRPYIPFTASKYVLNTEFRYSQNKTHLEIRIPAEQTELRQDFWIDQIPVTIASYKHCVSKGSCNPPHYRNYFTKYYSNPVYRFLPVSFVSWNEALAYCQSEGGNLPSELQWNMAAGYAQNNLYPWGDEEPSMALANFDGYYQGLIPAGSLPQGASPFGVLDMGGNVREWMIDVFIRENYTDTRSPDVIFQTTVQLSEAERILKGGSSSDLPKTLEVKTHQWHGQNSPGFNRGFRCVYPDEQVQVF